MKMFLLLFFRIFCIAYFVGTGDPSSDPMLRAYAVDLLHRQIEIPVLGDGLIKCIAWVSEFRSMMFKRVGWYFDFCVWIEKNFVPCCFWNDSFFFFGCLDVGRVWIIVKDLGFWDDHRRVVRLSWPPCLWFVVWESPSVRFSCLMIRMAWNRMCLVLVEYGRRYGHAFVRLHRSCQVVFSSESRKILSGWDCRRISW